MTTRFRIETIQLETTNGPVQYVFSADLTVLAGPSGAGKTTLLELIKFGFGGTATLAEVAELHVESVGLLVRIGDHRLRLTRSLDRAKRKTVRVFDVIDQQQLPDHHVGAGQPSLNSLLLNCFGLPDDLRAAASGNSTRPGNRITFNDIFTYLYIPQSQINRDIAYSRETVREPKRRAVFELLFDLVSPDLLKLRSEINALKGEIADAEARRDTVVQFLRDSGTRSRDDALGAQNAAEQTLTRTQSRLEELRDAIDPVLDRETQTLRDLLTEAERGLADSRAAAIDLARRQAHNNAERTRVQTDLGRLNRMRDAGERLADIEFTVCPRCMQSIKKRTVPAGSCRLCLQSDPVSTPTEHDHYEVRQLTEQLSEMSMQERILSEQHAVVLRLSEERERLISYLTKTLEERTSLRVSPRLQAFTDLSSQAAAAAANKERWEAVLRQWDSVADLEAAADQLRVARENSKSRLNAATRELDERRAEVIEQVSVEFDKAVRDIAIPTITQASIDPENYLPVINGTVFSSKSQLAGGVTTATQIAYWCSLLAVAVRRNDTLYPAFLIIDSPRLALNTATNVAAAMYRRLTTQADARPGKLQFIIADNELPDTYRGNQAQIDFDYDHPTVSTIEHPGPAQVARIATGELEDI
ncbi:hypothetical protein EDD29_5509 [Actinocorallia herbida]|uniref:Rad50/SbcC-type AAA domain-containing protein n=1 Tax=Actinocorallia herbida TaxID=58109 RepID=A0A3N1D2X2_9ACTN|nr:AAA family ATPase [Actinocorallia herbida]ROO87862.1 hypothetical protein EDD29_5509 [Actinocorallia herbida]